MNWFSIVAALWLLAPTMAFAEQRDDARSALVLPAPANMEIRDGVFDVHTGTQVFIPKDPTIAQIASYFADLMLRTRGMHLQIIERDNATAALSNAIIFKLDANADRSNAEGYEIDISRRQVTLSAREPRGLLYAAVTLWQLCTTEITRAKIIQVPAMRIVDAPRFAWRGLMLDSARHYQSPEFILRFIDWMAANKLNILHWHLTDDQGWRLEIRKYPRLTEVGAWRVPAGLESAKDIDPATGRPRLYGGFYSQADVKRIVAHAAQRNVTIVPEIEMPGHATAAIVAYPQLSATPTPPTIVPADWGVYSNLYNVEETTFMFLQDVLDEVMTLFPSPYIHVGGDEAAKDQWRSSPRVQARMHELGVPTEQALQSYFIQRIEKYLNAHGRRMIGWDEILEGGIAPNAAVMSWRGIEGAKTAASLDHDAVLAPAPTLYFDHQQRAMDASPGRGGVVSLEDVYRFDPLGTLTAKQSGHILGLQGNIWTEHIRSEARVEYMTFPRAAAVAEIGWSMPPNVGWADFKRRLPSQLARYRALGLHYAGSELLSAQKSANTSAQLRTSHQMQLCSDKLVLSLEDDAPIRGSRATFLVDIMNPCWIFRGADLLHTTLIAAVGQVPFNFQIGDDARKIPLRKPQTPAGELEVRIDSCEGERIAVLPLAPAAAHNDVTTLPAVRLPSRAGKHDLCFNFTQHSLDPIWVLNSIRLRDSFARRLQE